MNDKIALVTGVTREMGLGYGIIKGLAANGYLVYAGGRSISKVKDLLEKDDILKEAVAIELDITKDDSVLNALKIIKEKHHSLDVLVNNAAGYFDANNTVVESDLDMVADAFQTNTLGAWRLTVAALPLLKEANGATVVNVTSGAGSFHDGLFGMDNHPQHVPVYGVTKAAANAFTVKLAKEVISDNIKVNAVCPGWIATYPGTAEMGARPVEEAVPGILWATEYTEELPHGKFFRDMKELDW